jgi:hypothetical protein
MKYLKNKVQLVTKYKFQSGVGAVSKCAPIIIGVASQFSPRGHERTPESVTKNWQLSVHFCRLTVHLLNFKENQLH